MADIAHDFTISAPPERVFRAMATPDGLNAWWTLTAAGDPVPGGEYALGFGPGYDWRAVVRHVVPNAELEWEMTVADPDWLGTRVGFKLTPGDKHTRVAFYNTGWPEANGHFRGSSYCWAMYLRLLKRYVESGERVPYDRRLDA
jgi:uncharacterized protein YndB with AHSA1/START domain